MAVDDEHGLRYPDGFLQGLQTLLSRPAPHTPIRALSAAQFAELHRLNALGEEEERMGDSVLFPFLHGLEGSNSAQNSFFANAARGSTNYSHSLLPPTAPPVAIPRFRGLVWVKADELGNEQSGPTPSSTPLESDPDDDEMLPSDDDEEEVDKFDHTVMGMHPVHTRSASVSTASSDSRSPLSASTAPTSLPPSPASAGCGSYAFGCSGSTSPSSRSQLLTSTLSINDLLTSSSEGHCFLPPRVPDGISLRNFGIQVPIYATLSDVVIYSPKGLSRAAFALAERFKHAIEVKAREREKTHQDLVYYNVFIVTDPFQEFERNFPHLVAVDSRGMSANYIDFAAREREEMCSLTRASEVADGLWLGNLNDVPTYQEGLLGDDPFLSQGNPLSLDICVECCDGAQFPSSAELACAESHIRRLDEVWQLRWQQQQEQSNKDNTEPAPLRPPPSANHVMHLAFPSSPMPNSYTINHLLAFISFLHRVLYPSGSPPPSPSRHSATSPPRTPTSPLASPGSSWTHEPTSPGTRQHHRTSSESSAGKRHHTFIPRKCKVLLYSSDGYTESSILALCFLMAPKPAHYVSPQVAPSALMEELTSSAPTNGNPPPLLRSLSGIGATHSSSSHGMSLPDAYLELQNAKGRSFFVYPSDMDLLKKMEARFAHHAKERERDRGRDHALTTGSIAADGHTDTGATDSSTFGKWKWSTWGSRASFSIPSSTGTSSEFGISSTEQQQGGAGPFSMHNLSSSTPNASLLASGPPRKRARASTSPMPHVLADHWAWFSDPRFDGSFPSRVLPFLYLGNLAHASNAYMLHALGITHVVSVGESALVPPQRGSQMSQAAEYRFSYGGKVLGAGPGSLWLEEGEGRIKVLDMKGVSDDGIDSLRPRFKEVCEWIDAARKEGGKVLVHCRVGVSRSATITIGYVMKHQNMSLVDAYLLVRSRRLSVLIQPNLRLLYNLYSWESELAQECGQKDPDTLRSFLCRRLTWPYLAREVHALNEKYIQ